jgi:malate permease and related proteins
LSSVLDTIVPVFCVIAVGYLLAGHRGMHLPTLADLALLVTSPCLMFSVLAGTEVDLGRWAALAGAAVWTMLGTGLLGAAYMKIAGVGRGVLLSSMFWNAGNMGLACARLAFGPEGLESAAVLFVTVAVFTSSVGIWVAKGDNGFVEALRMPLLYASVGGLLMALTGTELPRMVMEPIEMLGAMAIPLMLLNLGFQLRTLEVGDFGHALVAVAIRVAGGFGFVTLFIALFAVTGIDRQVLLLHSVMPAAVINAVMAQRYGTDPELVASSIVIGTLISLLTIPAVLLLAS